MKIIVLAGTSDGARIIEYLDSLEDIDIIATTTTSYGGELASCAGANEVLVGGLDDEDMMEIIKQKKVDLLVDATHPFASEATKNAINASKKSEISYIRFERPSINYGMNENLYLVNDFEEASNISSELIKGIKNGRILHLAGVSTISQIIKKIPVHSLVVRVLPAVYSIKKCLEIGISSENIIAMQGIFSTEFNRILMEEYDVDVVITKESGESGGTLSKIEAASQLGIPIVMVKRPKILELENLEIYSDIAELIERIKKFKK